MEQRDSDGNDDDGGMLMAMVELNDITESGKPASSCRGYPLGDSSNRACLCGGHVFAGVFL